MLRQPDYRQLIPILRLLGGRTCRMSQFGDLFSTPILGFEKGKKLKQCNSVRWPIAEKISAEICTWRMVAYWWQAGFQAQPDRTLSAVYAGSAFEIASAHLVEPDFLLMPTLKPISAEIFISSHTQQRTTLCLCFFPQPITETGLTAEAAKSHFLNKNYLLVSAI